MYIADKEINQGSNEDYLLIPQVNKNSHLMIQKPQEYNWHPSFGPIGIGELI